MATPVNSENRVTSTPSSRASITSKQNPDELSDPVFLLTADDLNRVPPADIIDELTFYPGGAGGGPGCQQFFEVPPTSPVIADAEDSAEKMQLIEITTCGWVPGEHIVVSIYDPNGKVIWQGIEKAWQGELWISHTVAWNEPEGIYVFQFKSAEDSITHQVDVIRPVGPRLYQSKDFPTLYLYQFRPLERVRLFIFKYNDPGGRDSFLGWLEVRMTSKGSLVINNMLKSTDYDLGYAAVGEISGEVLYQIEGWDKYWYWGSGDIYCKDAPMPRREIGINSVVQVTVDEITAYEYIGTMSGQVIFPRGTRIWIMGENSPICKDHMFWWYSVALDGDAPGPYWIPDGKGNEYYIELDQ